MCDAGWYEAENECYKYFKNDTGVTYSDAKQLCQNQQNGYLAKIRSAKSQTAINSLGKNNFISIFQKKNYSKLFKIS